MIAEKQKNIGVGILVYIEIVKLHLSEKHCPHLKTSVEVFSKYVHVLPIKGKWCNYLLTVNKIFVHGNCRKLTFDVNI